MAVPVKKSPMQKVKERFGSKEELAKQIMNLLGEKDKDFEKALRGTTNKKLLKIYTTAKIINKRFGSRKKLIQAISALDFPKGKPDENYMARIESYPIKKLYHLYLLKEKKQGAKQ